MALSTDIVDPTVEVVDPLLIDLSLAKAFGEPVLGDKPVQGAGLYELGAVYEQAARLLRQGDELERQRTMPVSLLTLREMLAWAALTVACDLHAQVPGEDDRHQELNERRESLQRQLTRRTQMRSERQTSELLACLTADEERCVVLEETLHEICSRLEYGMTVPDGAVVEILRAVVAAVGAGRPSPGAKPPADAFAAGGGP